MARLFICVTARVSRVAALAILGMIATALAIAQMAGDKIEYKSQSWPEKWEIGTFLKELPGGTQVLIREKPSQFFPEGFERAVPKGNIRPVARQQTEPVTKPVNDPDAKRAKPQPGNADGLMSESDILSFLGQRLGDGDPFMNPRREAVLEELRQEVMSRGVNFRYNTISDFSNRLAKYGAVSNVRAPISENFGPLGKQAGLMGTWRFAKVGAPAAPIFGNAGSMTIYAAGTYVWNTPSGIVRGPWRKATPGEMAKSDKGGEGVVLLTGKGGWDWLVFIRNEIGPQGQGIMVTDLGTRSLRERGVR